MIRHHPNPPLFPYPPLFRSRYQTRPASPPPGGTPPPLSPCPLLPLHAARRFARRSSPQPATAARTTAAGRSRSEEHTSELQSHSDLVCRLLLEKKKKTMTTC